MELKRYYKILQGYEHERDISITEDELERAYGVFMIGGRWIFSGGPVDGKNIQTVVEDFQKTMGWSKEHRLEAEDYNELADLGVDKKMRDALARAKERVQYLLSTKQEALIGTGAKLPELDKPRTEKRVGNIVPVGKFLGTNHN